MNQSAVATSLAAMADVLTVESPEIERVVLVVVGGAAGLLAGDLGGDRTTTDCDVLSCEPPSARAGVERAAAIIAEQLGLADGWLNPGGAPWAEGLPEGWRERCRVVLTRGPLEVRAVGRVDLMALKLLAGRPQDVEDLLALRMGPAEIAFVRDHLEQWSDDGWPRGVVDEAISLLEALESAVPMPGTEHHGARTHRGGRGRD